MKKRIFNQVGCYSSHNTGRPAQWWQWYFKIANSSCKNSPRHLHGCTNSSGWKFKKGKILYGVCFTQESNKSYFLKRNFLHPLKINHNTQYMSRSLQIRDIQSATIQHIQHTQYMSRSLQTLVPTARNRTAGTNYKNLNGFHKYYL